MRRCEAQIITLGAEHHFSPCPNPAAVRLENSKVPDVYPVRFYCRGHGQDRMSWEQSFGDLEVAMIEIKGEDEEE